MIWGGSPQEIILFIEELNLNDMNIRLTFSLHPETLSFHDLSIHVENNKLSTKTFRKKTAANTLLFATSHHPKSLIQGSQLGSFSKPGETSQVRKTLKMEAQKLYGRLRERGYSHGCIRKAKKRAYEIDRGTSWIRRGWWI